MGRGGTGSLARPVHSGAPQTKEPHRAPNGWLGMPAPLSAPQLFSAFERVFFRAGATLVAARSPPFTATPVILPPMR